MMRAKTRFTLDVQEASSQIAIPVTLGDTAREFYITLTDGGRPFAIPDGFLAMITIKRPTGTYLQAFCPVLTGSTVVYDFQQNENTAAAEGLHECELTIYGPTMEVVSSPWFTMIVSRRVVNSDSIALTDENRTAVDAMLAAEARRQSAEAERQEAENARGSAEEERRTYHEKLQASVNNGEFDGLSATHSWNGTVLTISSGSGTSSMDLKGDPGEKGEKGDKGDPGEKGEQGTFDVVTYMGGKYTGAIEGANTLTFDSLEGIGLGVKDGKVFFGIDPLTFPKELKGNGGSGLPEVTEADNGKIPMVVAGQWENVDFPAGTQYEVNNMIVPASSWVDNGSMIHAVVYGFEKNLDGCHVGVFVSASATKDQIAEMARCGVMGRTATGTEVTLEALYAIPEIDLPFDFVITKPTTLAYSVDEESMTLTIVEGDGNE